MNVWDMINELFLLETGWNAIPWDQVQVLDALWQEIEALPGDCLGLDA